MGWAGEDWKIRLFINKRDVLNFELQPGTLRSTGLLLLFGELAPLRKRQDCCFTTKHIIPKELLIIWIYLFKRDNFYNTKLSFGRSLKLIPTPTLSKLIQKFNFIIYSLNTRRKYFLSLKIANNLRFRWSHLRQNDGNSPERKSW